MACGLLGWGCIIAFKGFYINNEL